MKERITEEVFRRLIKTADPAWDYRATGKETVADGVLVYAIDRESITDENGLLIAELRHEPPRHVGTGCPYRSGLMSGDTAEQEQV